MKLSLKNLSFNFNVCHNKDINSGKINFYRRVSLAQNTFTQKYFWKSTNFEEFHAYNLKSFTFFLITTTIFRSMFSHLLLYNEQKFHWKKVWTLFRTRLAKKKKFFFLLLTSTFALQQQKNWLFYAKIRLWITVQSSLYLRCAMYNISAAVFSWLSFTRESSRAPKQPLYSSKYRNDPRRCCSPYNLYYYFVHCPSIYTSNYVIEGRNCAPLTNIIYEYSSLYRGVYAPRV